MGKIEYIKFCFWPSDLWTGPVPAKNSPNMAKCTHIFFQEKGEEIWPFFSAYLAEFSFSMKFSLKLNHIKGSKSQKKTRTISWMLNWYQKFLKIFNLTTKYAILMKVTKIVYYHETFYFARNWAVTHRVWRGCRWKIP